MALDLATRMERTKVFTSTAAQLRTALRKLAQISRAFNEGGVSGLSNLLGVSLCSLGAASAMLDCACARANVQEELEARRAERRKVAA